MIILVAIIKAKPGREAVVETHLRSQIPLVQEKEQGTLVYVLHRALRDPGIFMLYEKYPDRTSLDMHISTPHVNKMIQDIENDIIDVPAISFFEQIDEIRR